MGTVLFNENRSELGFKSFVPASELYDRTAGYLMSNMCIIKAKVAALQDTPASEPFCTKVATPVVIIEDPGTEISSKKESNREQPSKVNSGQAQVFSAAPKTISSEQVADLQDTPDFEPICTKATHDDRLALL
ncbi:hypothetical protein RchiOBHm_Chr5g0042501 [Rosa chinensis]|uniref:MATH domain-containing protein n=1 Tax=Rosa chinensis TaxID=74649 RepID=A0A2P6QD47_ROSCH|nr:hypothetical protein RchiOBHm_Chr5g0042501 [Rosa chinensis]